MKSSNALKNCKGIDEVIELINNAPITEGTEGIEFSPDELAAEYAYDAAKENLCEDPIGNKELEAHLDILR